MTETSLQPVDSVAITTIVANVSDMLLQDQGPAKRPPLGDVAPPVCHSRPGGQLPRAFCPE